MEDQAAEIIAEIGDADLGRGSREDTGARKLSYEFLLEADARRTSKSSFPLAA